MSRNSTTRSRRTRGLLASFAAVALGFTGLVALGTSAAGTQPAPEYITVAWIMPSWNGTDTSPGTATWPQDYFAQSAVTQTPALNALDGQLTTCGVPYQVDVYKNDDTTAALLAAAVTEGWQLTGPSTPLPESHVNPGQWKFVYTACVEEQPPTDPPVEEQPPTDPPVEEQPPTDPPVEEAPPIVTQTSLAETGLPLLGALGLAGAFSLIGGGLVNAGRILRNRN